MKKKIFCRVTGLVLALCLLCGMLSRLGRLTVLKGFPNRYDDFLGTDRQYDVLLLGNSHLWDGVYPLELWNRQGISSYNLGFAGASIGALYWLFLCALDHAEPEVLVLDCSSLSSGAGGQLSFFRNALAAFPFSLNKIRAAWDLCPPGEYTAEDRLALIWGFSAFHDRWSGLSAEDFTWEEPKLRGAYPLANLAEVPPPYVTAEKEFSDNAASNLRYLRLFEEECRKRGIRLVLITLPFSASEKDAMIANAVADFAAGLDIPYLNLLEGAPVDYRCDFADRDAHLNISGACKVSAFLADYLSESCGLPDHRSDSGFDDWDADYASWIGTMDARVKEQNYLKHTLMLLSHPRYMPVIYISPGSALFGDSHIQALLRSLCGGSELPGFAEAAAAEKSYLLFYDRNAGKRYEAVGSTSIPDTPYGEILVLPENGLVRLGGTESTLAVVSGNAASGELQCYVFTADMTPLPACSHSFGPGDGGEYYRNDYPD